MIKTTCIRATVWRGAIGAIFTCALVPATAGGAPHFADVAVATGLGNYRGTAGDGHGPGVVFTDLDGDHWPELVLLTGLGEPSYVYPNHPSPQGRRFGTPIELPGHDACTLVDPVPGGTDPGDLARLGATGAVPGDYDNDGDVDLFLTTHPASAAGDFAPNRLYRNLLVDTGTLAFEDATCETDPSPGVSDGQHGLAFGERTDFANCESNEVSGLLDNALTAAWSDVDRDGDLDLFVGNHDGVWLQGNPSPQEAAHVGQRDILYLNQLMESGTATFVDRTLDAGTTGFETEQGACKATRVHPITGEEETVSIFSSTNAATFADLNNDGWPDLLVTNKSGGDHVRDMLYRNRGIGANGQWLGFRVGNYNLPSGDFGRVSSAAMGIDTADFDNDGDLDVYITDRADGHAGQNDLFRNQATAGGAFDLVWDGSMDVPAVFSWAANWLDVDNDGRFDLHVSSRASGVAPDGQVVERHHFLYRQVLDPATGTWYFEDQSDDWMTDSILEARGTGSADYDLDGDVDLFVVIRDDQPSLLWQNQLDPGGLHNQFLYVDLIGDPSLAPAPHRSTKDAIGARVYVTADFDGPGPRGVETQMQELKSGSGNAASASSLTLRFGTGDATEVDMEVHFPSGRVRNAIAVPVNRLVTVHELP